MLRTMLDIECLSLRPEAVVLQIGYCTYDFKNRKYVSYGIPKEICGDIPGAGFLNLDVDSQIAAGRHVDFSTIKWWMGVDPKVREDVFSTAFGRVAAEDAWDPVAYICRNSDEIWAGPAMYDLPIITSLFKGEKPWEDYRKERCLSTFAKAVDPLKTLQPPDNGSAHNGAADAKWQMEYLIRLMDYVEKCYMVPGSEMTQVVILDGGAEKDTKWIEP